MPSPASSSTSAPVKGRLEVDAGVDAAATESGDGEVGDAVSGRALLAGVTAAAATVPVVTVPAVTVLTGGGVTVPMGAFGGVTQSPGSVIDWVTMHWAPATAGIDSNEAAATHEPTTALLIHFIVSNFR